MKGIVSHARILFSKLFKFYIQLIFVSSFHTSSSLVKGIITRILSIHIIARFLGEQLLYLMYLYCIIIGCRFCVDFHLLIYKDIIVWGFWSVYSCIKEFLTENLGVQPELYLKFCVLLVNKKFIKHENH